MDSTNDAHLSFTSILLALAVIGISVAGLVGNVGREAAPTDAVDQADSVIVRRLIVDLPSAGDSAVAVAGLDPRTPLALDHGSDHFLATETGSGALVTVFAGSGRLIGLAMVPPGLSAEVDSIAVTVDTTALALVGLIPGLTSADPLEMSAIWAVASDLTEFDELRSVVETSIRLDEDLADPSPDLVESTNAVVAATDAALAETVAPIDLADCPSASGPIRGAGPGACVRLVEESAFVENGLPRWGQLVAPGASGSLAICELVPPATERTLVGDGTQSRQLGENLARLVGVGEADGLFDAAALSALGGPGEPSVLPIGPGPACPDRLRFVTAGAGPPDMTRARQAQLLTVLTRYTAPLGQYLGATLRSEDPVGTVLEAPVGSLEAVARLEGDPDLRAVDATRPGAVAARNRATVAAGTRMYADDGIRSVAGINPPARAGHDIDIGVRCSDCDPVELQPLDLGRLTEMMAGIVGSLPSRLLYYGAAGESTATFSMGAAWGGPSLQTTLPAAASTTSIADPISPGSTPPPGRPPRPVAVLGLSLSYPTLDDTGAPFTVDFTASNTGTAPVDVTAEQFWVSAGASDRVGPSSASFTSIRLGPGESRSGSMVFDPEPGSVPDVLGLTTAVQTLEIPL